MLTTAALKAYTLKDLAQMAKKRGVPGWHSMRKEQLVRALARLERAQSKTSGQRSPRGRTKSVGATKTRATRGAKAKLPSGTNGKAKKAIARKASPNGRANASVAPKQKRKPSRVQRKIHAAHVQREKLKDLSQRFSGFEQAKDTDKDRLVLMVRDPYWLHAYWELTSRSVDRAQVALAENWHGATPILRLLKIANLNTVDNSEEVTREIEIHGAVRNWYIDVQDPPSAFRAEVGYRTIEGQFHALARSNTVTTPTPGSTEMLDGNWADVAENCEKIYAMSGGYEGSSRSGELQELFEERLRRPMGSPMVTRFGAGAENALEKQRGLCFDIDAEMIVYGITKPDAYVTMAGEPVKLRTDGSFTARVGLPERRQVIPVVASSADGVEQQTIVLAVERNTKVMEPIVRDHND